MRDRRKNVYHFLIANWNTSYASPRAAGVGDIGVGVAGGGEEGVGVVHVSDKTEQILYFRR